MTRPIKTGALRCIWDAGRLLGEGPWWSFEDQALYWLDIKRPAVLRCDASGGNRQEWRSPEMIGCFAPRVAGGFVGGFESGIATFELGADEEIALTALTRPKEFADHDRFNDGKCHPDGTFWAGTMDNREKDARGHFYRLENGELETLSGPHMVCNGPTFSPDGRLAYIADSAAQRIYRMDIDSGEIETFVTFAEGEGYPDGMTTDRDGNLWIAFWDGWKVRCIAPDSTRLQEIDLPVARPTSCTFGGKNLSTLFISSASVGIDDDQLANQPQAGGLFACDIDGTAGRPTPAFAG